MNEELTSRNDLYNILKTAHQMKAINSMVNTEAIKLLTDQHGYDERVVNNFMQVFKKRFLKVILILSVTTSLRILFIVKMKFLTSLLL